MIYTSKSLSENIDEVSSQLYRATVDNKHPFRFLTFCTVSENILPEARMVVLRKCNGLDEIRIYTDKRSQKIAALENNPNCKLIFWHPRSRVQVSLLASAVIFTNEAVAKSLTTETAKQYNSILTPGSVIEKPADAYFYDRMLTEINFCEIICSIKELDVLKLDKNGHLRIKGYKYDYAWKLSWVSP